MLDRWVLQYLKAIKHSRFFRNTKFYFRIFSQKWKEYYEKNSTFGISATSNSTAAATCPSSLGSSWFLIWGRFSIISKIFVHIQSLLGARPLAARPHPLPRKAGSQTQNIPSYLSPKYTYFISSLISGVKNPPRIKYPKYSNISCVTPPHAAALRCESVQHH